MDKARTWLDALVISARELIDGGLSAPTAQDIEIRALLHSYGITAPIGQTRQTGPSPADIGLNTGKQLHKIREKLRSDWMIETTLVNKRYYNLFHETPPTNADDAKLCLGNGRWKDTKPAGLRKHTGPDDLIWEQQTLLNLKSGAGKIKKQVDKIGDGLASGGITESAALQQLEEPDRIYHDQHPNIAALRSKEERDISELPEPDDEQSLE